MGIIIEKSTGIIQTGFKSEAQMIEHGFTTDSYEYLESEDNLSEEYKNKIEQNLKNSQKAELQLQIDELDRKRVRAIAEPSIKDSTTGQTWLEYYSQEVASLRGQLKNI